METRGSRKQHRSPSPFPFSPTVDNSKTGLSVALKSSKKDIIDQIKLFEKKIENSENKIKDLNEFKINTIEQKREEQAES